MPRRRPMRLRHFDYASPAAYFVTICTRDRLCILGEVVNGIVSLNENGRLVQRAWKNLPNHYPHVEIDCWVIMPNHIHGILVLTGKGGNRVGTKGRAGLKPAPTEGRAAPHGLPEVVRAFKTFSARRINLHRGTSGSSLWQRGYFEHVIRSESSLNRIRRYIVENPLRWDEDLENPAVRE